MAKIDHEINFMSNIYKRLEVLVPILSIHSLYSEFTKLHNLNELTSEVKISKTFCAQNSPYNYNQNVKKNIWTIEDIKSESV